MAITALTDGKTIKRKVGNLIVEIDGGGLTLRKYRCRTRKRLTWEQVAALDHRQSIMQTAEIAAGRRELEQLGIVLIDADDAEE